MSTKQEKCVTTGENAKKEEERNNKGCKSVSKLKKSTLATTINNN